jgi:hypothetical protein
MQFYTQGNLCVHCIALHCIAWVGLGATKGNWLLLSVKCVSVQCSSVGAERGRSRAAAEDESKESRQTNRESIVPRAKSSLSLSDCSCGGGCHLSSLLLLLRRLRNSIIVRPPVRTCSERAGLRWQCLRQLFSAIERERELSFFLPFFPPLLLKETEVAG